MISSKSKGMDEPRSVKKRKRGLDHREEERTDGERNPVVDVWFGPVLVKIPRMHCQPSEQRAVVYQLAGNQVNDLALAFHYTMHGEKL